MSSTSFTSSSRCRPALTISSTLSESSSAGLIPQELAEPEDRVQRRS